MKTNSLQLTKPSLSTLIVLLLIVAGMTKVFAQNFTVGDLNYSVNSDGTTVTITGHVDGTSASGTLAIPSSVSYEGSLYTVSAIGGSAFSNCSGFSGDLIIPNSVTTIGSSAFWGCTGFERLKNPSYLSLKENRMAGTFWPCRWQVAMRFLRLET